MEGFEHHSWGLEEATLRLERGMDFLAPHSTAFSDRPNDLELVVPAGNLPVLWAMTGAPGLGKDAANM